jgi:hypothetical protein
MTTTEIPERLVQRARDAVAVALEGAERIIVACEALVRLEHACDVTARDDDDAATLLARELGLEDIQTLFGMVTVAFDELERKTGCTPIVLDGVQHVAPDMLFELRDKYGLRC